MATKKKNATIQLEPGRKAFTTILAMNADILNLSEIERIGGITPGALRHIRTGGRVATAEQYKQLQKELLPKLLQLVFVLQNYPDPADQ